MGLMGVVQTTSDQLISDVAIQTMTNDDSDCDTEGKFLGFNKTDVINKNLLSGIDEPLGAPNRRIVDDTIEGEVELIDRTNGTETSSSVQLESPFNVASNSMFAVSGITIYLMVLSIMNENSYKRPMKSKYDIMPY
uniref:Uncharacterized protein n=1 Tax=Glossina austeni TaxID=7395 RepID=A0A1A9V4U0_GLOAU